MTTFLRRLRGVLGTATAWGVSWFGVAAGFFGLRSLGTVSLGTVSLGTVLFTSLGVGAAGFIAGGGFAAVLALTERKKSIGALTYPRIALWGFLGSSLVAVPLLFELRASEGILALVLAGVFGAASSVGSLAIARAADARVLPEGSAAALGAPAPGHRPALEASARRGTSRVDDR